jgi:hypothetical protein
MKIKGRIRNASSQSFLQVKQLHVLADLKTISRGPPTHITLTETLIIEEIRKFIIFADIEINY